MKKYLNYIVLFLIILLCAFIAGYYYNGKKQTQTTTINPADMLQDKIDSLYHIQDSLFKKINQIDSNQEYYIDLIDKNNELIFKNNHELTKIKNSYDEKVHNANNYSIKQLDSFFTNRYKGY